MATTFSTTGDAQIGGDLRLGGTIRPDIARTNLEKETSTAYPIPLTQGRVWDALASLLPSSGGTDDLGLITGTWGTDVPSLQTGDVKAAGAVTRRARFTVVLPPEYDAGGTVKIRVAAGMKTTAADVSATVDVEVYKNNRDALITGADLVTTAATTMNSLTFGDKDFVLTATSLAPGDILDVRISVATNDAATATAVIAVIGSLDLVCDIRG